MITNQFLNIANFSAM